MRKTHETPSHHTCLSLLLRCCSFVLKDFKNTIKMFIFIILITVIVLEKSVLVIYTSKCIMLLLQNKHSTISHKLKFQMKWVPDKRGFSVLVYLKLWCNKSKYKQCGTTKRNLDTSLSQVYDLFISLFIWDYLLK